MYGQQHHQQMPPRTPGRQAQAPLAPSTTNVTSSSTPTPSVPPMLRSSTSNPFLRPSTPTFTTYRGRRHSPRLDDDDDDDDSRDEDEDLESVASSDLVVTPLPRRRIPQFQRHHSKPTSGLALNVVTPNKGRRMSDGMVVVGNDTGDELMACDGPGGSPRTPRRDSGRRGSLLCGKSLVRIAALLRDESNPLDKEIAHERALNTSQSLLFPSGATPDTTMLDTTAVGTASGGGVDTMPPPSPADSACATPPPSFGSRAMSLSVPDDNGRPGTPDEMNALAAAATPPAVPVRAVAIPNSALKDPATYVSHSSKLNPENNSNIFTRPHHHKKHDEMMLLSSPCLSPIHPSVMPFGNMSPVNLERKCKRKLSGDADRFEPYKRPHRMPASPTARDSSGGSATNSPTASYFSIAGNGSGSAGGSSSGMRAGSTPPPFSLPIPSLVFQRQRSPSMGSTSSGWNSMMNTSNNINNSLSSNNGGGDSDGGMMAGVAYNNSLSNSGSNSNLNSPHLAQQQGNNSSGINMMMMMQQAEQQQQLYHFQQQQQQYNEHYGQQDQEQQQQQQYQGLQQGPAPGTPSPRSMMMGQRLNLTGAQEVFTKMSIKDRQPQ